MREQSRITQSRHERKFNEILKLPGNDRCADCNAKNARWCSYNLGIFLCIKCAALHRKIGCHISKVKSLSMDSWSNEQIENIRNAGGNQKVNSRMNPHPERHPLPSEEDDDSAMEQYIRRKWEKKVFQEIDNDNNNIKMDHQINSIQTVSSPVLMNSSFEISPPPLLPPSQLIQGSPVVSNLSSPSSFSVEEFAGQVQQQDMNIFQLSTTNPFYTTTSNINTTNNTAATSFNNNPFYSSPPPTTNNPFIMNDHPKSNNPFL